MGPWPLTSLPLIEARTDVCAYPLECVLGAFPSGCWSPLPPGLAACCYAGPGTRTKLDPSPPPEQIDRLAYYFLPACCYFLVEFTYDDPRQQAGASPIGWQAVPPGQQICWSKLPVDPPQQGQAQQPQDRWPRALRITIRAYDQAGGLDQPVEYTLIHCW